MNILLVCILFIITLENNKIYRLLIVIITTLSSFNTGFMGSAINIALPVIGMEFNASAISISWISTAFLLTTAITLLPFGKFSDIYGRAKFFKLGVMIFAVSSLVCGLSSNTVLMIAFRSLQGVGSSMISTTAITILVSIFPITSRGKMIGINTTGVYLGLSSGPFLGGLILQYIGWRYIFYSSFLLMAICGILALIVIRQDWYEKAETVDFKGSVYYIIIFSVIVLGLTSIKSIFGIILFAVGILLLMIFIKSESKIENPILDLNIFRSNKQFTFSNIAALINYLSTFAIAFLMSLYLQTIRELSAQQAGLILVTQPIMMAIFSPLAGIISDKIEPRIVASIGMAILSAGLIVFIFLTPYTSIAIIVFNLAFIGFGFALFSSPNTNAVMSSVDKKYFGVAASTLGSMRMFGQLLSMSFVTIIFSFVIGPVKIEHSVSNQLLISLKYIFITFSILSIFAIFASLFRGTIHEKNR